MGDGTNEEMKKYLEKIAGGNIDDAYYGGLEDGETSLARGLLERFGDKA